MLKNKTVLITGATGFVGSNLTRKLVTLGCNVHVFIKRTSNRWRIRDILDQVTEHETDLRNYDQLKKLVSKIKPQIIYHLAVHGSYPFQQNIEEMIKTNILGTVNLLNALATSNYQCFINTGSSSEYGFKNKPMKEEDLLEPISFYAVTKASSTLLCQVFAKTFDMSIITLRPFSVYGYYEESTRLIPTAIISCIKGVRLKLTSGEQKHDFVFIDDVIDAYLRAPCIEDIAGEIINIGSGRQYSNEEVVSKIGALLGKQIKVNKGAYLARPWDATHWVANNLKAKELLGWKPKHRFEEGLRKTIDWFKKNLKYYEQKL